jgi:hypothetical protein
MVCHEVVRGPQAVEYWSKLQQYVRVMFRNGLPFSLFSLALFGVLTGNDRRVSPTRAHSEY